MEPRKLSKKEDLDALLIGLGIMGTGGGGDPKGWGASVFDADRAAARVYQLVDPDDVADDAFILSGGYLGSIADEQELTGFVAGWESDFELEKAIRILEKEHGRKVDFLVPFELGGGNTPVVMSCATRLGVPVIDGDGIGRAAPETHMSSFLGHGISLMPMPLVGADGTSVLVRDGDCLLADAVGRCVASRKRGFLANAHYGMSGAELKRAVVRNTISKALELGRCVAGLAASDDAVKVVGHFLGAKLVLIGEVRSRVEVEVPGFFGAHVEVAGTSENGDCLATLVVKNEVMSVKCEGKTMVMFPDLAFLIDPETGEGLMSTDLMKGREVAVLASPCSSVVREAALSPVGRAAFSPSRYGEEGRYTPLDELGT